jgi:hypothetical protein
MSTPATKPVATKVAAKKPVAAAAPAKKFEPKRKADVLETPVADDADAGVEDEEVKAEPAKKAKFSAVKGEAKSEGPTEKWSQTSTDVAGLQKIYQDLTIVSGGKTKYFAQIAADGSVIKTIKLLFENRLIPMGMQYFPKSKEISNDGFCVNFAITDEEYAFFKNEFFLWCRQQIHKDPAAYFDAKSVAAFLGKTWEENNTLLSTFFGDLLMPRREKNGKSLSATFKSKIRQDFNPETEQGTLYPTVDIFDATGDNAEKPKCLYFHPPALTKKQLENKEKVAEFKAAHRKAIADMKKNHPNRVAIKEFVPRFCFADIEVDLLGITTLKGSWYISISTKEITIVEFSKTEYKPRNIGDAPTSRRAGKVRAAIAPVGDVAAEAEGEGEEAVDGSVEVEAEVDADADGEPIDNDGEPADDADMAE